MIIEEPAAKFAVIQEILAAPDNLVTVKDLCDIAGVSRSGYYRWINAESYRASLEAQDRTDFQLILDAYNYRSYK